MKMHKQEKEKTRNNADIQNSNTQTDYLTQKSEAPRNENENSYSEVKVGGELIDIKNKTQE